jgi:hypothetical protein
MMSRGACLAFMAAAVVVSMASAQMPENSDTVPAGTALKKLEMLQGKLKREQYVNAKAAMPVDMQCKANMTVLKSVIRRYQHDLSELPTPPEVNAKVKNASDCLMRNANETASLKKQIENNKKMIKQEMENYNNSVIYNNDFRRRFVYVRRALVHMLRKFENGFPPPMPEEPEEMPMPEEETGASGASGESGATGSVEDDGETGASGSTGGSGGTGPPEDFEAVEEEKEDFPEEQTEADAAAGAAAGQVGEEPIAAEARFKESRASLKLASPKSVTVQQRNKALERQAWKKTNAHLKAAANTFLEEFPSIRQYMADKTAYNARKNAAHARAMARGDDEQALGDLLHTGRRLLAANLRGGLPNVHAKANVLMAATSDNATTFNVYSALKGLEKHFRELGLTEMENQAGDFHDELTGDLEMLHERRLQKLLEGLQRNIIAKQTEQNATFAKQTKDHQENAYKYAMDKVILEGKFRGMQGVARSLTRDLKQVQKEKFETLSQRHRLQARLAVAGADLKATKRNCAVILGRFSHDANFQMAELKALSQAINNLVHETPDCNKCAGYHAAKNKAAQIVADSMNKPAGSFDAPDTTPNTQGIMADQHAQKVSHEGQATDLVGELKLQQQELDRLRNKESTP